tara:strand:- start:46 stop:693 length:648 start_codon:yes stop_codon:yes gene_type:complete
MDFNEFNHLSHIVIGTIAFIGGIVALSTKKGSRIHKTGGKVFVLGMFYSVISTVVFMTEEFLPLAVLMSVATVYLLISSISALRYKNKYSKTVDTILVIFPVLLFIFTFIQFVRILPEISLGTFARLLFSLTFAIVLLRDIKLIKNRPNEHIYFLKRHSFRMILAFGFAVMAILRIGVKIEFLGLAFTTFTPLLLALLAAFYAERNISKFLPNKK